MNKLIIGIYLLSVCTLNAQNEKESQKPWQEDFEDVCDEIVEAFDTGKDVFEAFRVEVLKVLGKDENIELYSVEMINILNENLTYFKCEKNTGIRMRDVNSLFKYVIELRYYDFVTNLVYKMSCGDGIDGKKFNINHYDILDGKKETLLDYINLILNSRKAVGVYDFSSLRKIKMDIKSCGAKKGSEL